MEVKQWSKVFRKNLQFFILHFMDNIFENFYSLEDVVLKVVLNWKLLIRTALFDSYVWFTREIFVSRSWFSAEDFHFGWRTVGWRRWLVRKGFTIDKNALSQNFAITSDRSKRRESRRRFGPFDFVPVARLRLRCSILLEGKRDMKMKNNNF